MINLKIYISSSWKNQHAVEMLTKLLRRNGHRVMSFVERNLGTGDGSDSHEAHTPENLDAWMETQEAEWSFEHDTKAATESDLVIYISPSGTDAWAEVGAAWGAGVPIVGLHSKGEQAGLMRKMMQAWFYRVPELIRFVNEFEVLKIKKDTYTRL